MRPLIGVPLDPLSGFHQGGPQDALVNDIADDASQLYPVSDFIKITERERDPSGNADDDFLQGKSDAGACDSENHRHLPQPVTENAGDEDKPTRYPIKAVNLRMR